MAVTSAPLDPLQRQTGLDADGRKERARAAAKARWSKADDEARAKVGRVLRESTMLRFEDEVDPHHELPSALRREQAELAWREFVRFKARLRWARWRALRDAGLDGDPEAVALADD